MTSHRSPASQLDLGVDALVAGAEPREASVGLDPAARRLLMVASQLQAALPVPVVAPRFEARLGTRLAEGAEHLDPLAWAARHRGPLLVTGAVGSAAVGVGFTAYAVWRNSRRAAGAAHRPVGR